MNLVEYHQTVGNAVEEEHGLVQAVSVAPVFEIEVDCPSLLADLAGQGGLSGLPGTDDGDRRLMFQSVDDGAT